MKRRKEPAKGTPTPDGGQVRVSVGFPRAEYRKLYAIAKKQKTSVTAVIRNLTRAGMAAV